MMSVWEAKARRDELRGRCAYLARRVDSLKRALDEARSDWFRAHKELEEAGYQVREAVAAEADAR